MDNNAFTSCKNVFQIILDCELNSPLIIKSGETGEITDSTVQKTPDNKVYINGYVISNLFIRCFKRIKNCNYDKLIDPGENDYQVSLFWIESSFIENVKFNIVPGIKVNRLTGSVYEKALYYDETIPKGEKFQIKINFFFNNIDEDFEEKFSYCLGIINSGIENIGGLWSYGYGRIKIIDASYKILDLSNENHRKSLWNFVKDGDSRKLEIKPPDSSIIKKGWIEIETEFKIPEGNFFAIHSNHPIIDNLNYPHLPDNFLFRTYVKENNNYIPKITIPGKAIRQGIFSIHIERYLRTNGYFCCDDMPENCICKRCEIFGSNKHRGLISISDGYIDDTADNTVVLSRIQLCEHSFQNRNLFSEEFLVKGSFKTKILIDKGFDFYNEDVYALIENILIDLKEDNSTYPPHWFRIGANSTCAGIINLKDYLKKEV